jgi:hypothetical protein
MDKMNKASVQTLVIKHDCNTGKSWKLRIVAGNKVQEINKSPSESYNGNTTYCTGKIVTAAMLKSQWYKNTQFSECGDSDWL